MEADLSNFEKCLANLKDELAKLKNWLANFENSLANFKDGLVHLKDGLPNSEMEWSNEYGFASCEEQGKKTKQRNNHEYFVS